MNQTAFLSKLGTMTRFPHQVRDYAESVAAKTDDKRRAALMAKLEEEYAGYVAADDKREKRQAEMADEVAIFKTMVLPKLEREAEGAERSASEHSLDAFFGNDTDAKTKTA